MCVCDPNIKAPFCGKPGCQMPDQEPKRPTVGVVVDSWNDEDFWFQSDKSQDGNVHVSFRLCGKTCRIKSPDMSALDLSAGGPFGLIEIHETYDGRRSVSFSRETAAVAAMVLARFAETGELSIPKQGEVDHG